MRGTAREARGGGTALRIVGILAILSLLGAGVVVAGVVVVTSAGVIRLSVDENKPGGMHLCLPPIPVRLVGLGAAFVPDQTRREVARQLAPYRPAIEAGFVALEQASDGPLVQVDGCAKERVSIVKAGGNLVVDVHDRTDDVHLELPIRALPRLLDQFAPAGETDAPEVAPDVVLDVPAHLTA